MFLVVLSGKQQGQVLKIIGRGVIGRDPGVEYSIDDPTVSRRHAEIIEAVDGWRVRDLGSANGTEVNGVRLIGDRSMREGDVIGMGRATLVFNAKLAQTVRGNGPGALADASADLTSPLGADQTENSTALVLGILRALQSDSSSAEPQACAALQAIVDAVPGALRASIIDWRAGRILARAPEGAEISRSTVFRALSALKSQHEGVLAWLPDVRKALGEQLNVAEVAPFIALPIDPQVGLLLEGHDQQCSIEPALGTLRDAAFMLRIALAALRAQAAAGSRKMRDSDLRLAQRIQQQMLSPAPTEVGNFEIAISYRPAMMIGGDFYHVEPRVGDELAVLIGDVSGKGVSAALYMAFLAADLRHLSKVSTGPGDLLQRIHVSMKPIFETGMFVTLASVFINVRTGLCRVGLAGHSAPVLRTAARKVMEMGLDPGMPIGADAELTIREQRLQLAPGDCLVLTTDGVDEGENHAGEPFGKDRRDKVLLSCQSAEEINAALRKELLGFVGRDHSTDDLTIICIGRKRT